MGKKSAPKAPAAPDPQQTIAAQTQSNKETAVANANLNRINQYTPQGSLTFNQIGTNPDGTPQYESRQTLSAGEQQLYDQQNQIANQLNVAAGQQIPRVQQAMNSNIDTSGFTPLQTGVNGGPIQNSIGYNGPGQKGTFGGYGDVQTSFADVGGPQRGLDYSGVSRLPGTDDFGAQSQEINDAVYKQATSRLDPRFQQEQNAMASSLAAKGVTEGSAAYNNAMDQFNRSKNDAYNQAQYSGIQAGANRQGQLFGMGLQARQQGVGEVNTQGQFANSAQQQAYDQAQGRAGFNNQAVQQQYEQAMGAAQFGNEAEQNAYDRAANNATFANNAQNQAYNQGQGNAALNNAARGTQFQEAAYQRNLPIQDIAALMGTAPGVQQPNFASYAPVNVANTDTAGITQQGYQNAYQRYQDQQKARSAGLGSMFGLAGSLGASAITKFSDRRLKANIKRVGETAGGIPTYTYNYIKSKAKQFGVMADEVFKVIPEAVSVDPSGYLMVDYGKVR